MRHIQSYTDVGNLNRSGNPLLTEDLERVSCGEARSIIVLATTGSPQQSDARVLRITLSLLGLHDRMRNDDGLDGLQVRHRRHSRSTKADSSWSPLEAVLAARWFAKLTDCMQPPDKSFHRLWITHELFDRDTLWLRSVTWTMSHSSGW